MRASSSVKLDLLDRHKFKPKFPNESFDILPELGGDIFNYSLILASLFPGQVFSDIKSSRPSVVVAFLLFLPNLLNLLGRLHLSLGLHQQSG